MGHDASCAPTCHEHRGVVLTYGCDVGSLGALGGRFRELALDDAARAFIDRSCDAPHGEMALWARRMLGAFLSDYDANGLLGIYPMHLLGTEQWRELLRDHSRGRLLDIGAGDGHVTATLAPLFEQVVVTETSRPMARRLEKRGFHVHAHDLLERPIEGPFDAVALLNVIDRTSRPLSLLRRARELLATNGAVIVATPLPIRAHVHVGPDTVDPEEPIDADGAWEAAAVAVAGTFERCGLRVESLSRAPYLSRGSARRPVWVLDDAIYVCSAR